MSRSHNKKRNVGIIYEQLLRTMATSLVSDNNKKYKATLGIVRKHFSPGTQLYKEFRLFNAMVKTTVDKESLATRILKEAKSAALDFDSEQLRKEKAALIKDINYTISDPTFYNQRINEYRKYATIQTLLNDWRSSGKAPLSRVADYENKVCNFLLTESSEEPIHVLKDEDISSLTVRIMTEKFNNKYGQQLNDEQQAIIKEYVFSTKTGQTTNFSAYLSELKESLITELEMYSSVCDNIILNEKMNKVTLGVSSLDPEQVNDETVSRFLLVSQLKEEIIGADNE